MHRSKRYYRHLRCFLLFLLPSLLIYTIFWIVPIIFNGVISFSSWNGVTAFSDIKWVGFQNFKNIFTNDIKMCIRDRLSGALLIVLAFCK